MNLTVETPLKNIFASISEKLGIDCLNYQVAEETGSTQTGVKYVTTDGRACAVSDKHSSVIFFICEGGEADQTPGPGMNQHITEKVQYLLVCQTKLNPLREILASIINKTVKAEYLGFDSQALNVAQTYFDVKQIDPKRYFFTIRFSVLERIICPEC